MRIIYWAIPDLAVHSEDTNFLGLILRNSPGAHNALSLYKACKTLKVIETLSH